MLSRQALIWLALLPGIRQTKPLSGHNNLAPGPLMGMAFRTFVQASVLVRKDKWDMQFPHSSSRLLSSFNDLLCQKAMQPAQSLPANQTLLAIKLAAT